VGVILLLLAALLWLTDVSGAEVEGPYGGSTIMEPYGSP